LTIAKSSNIIALLIANDSNNLSGSKNIKTRNWLKSKSPELRQQ